jgi:hypothetical protein
VPTLLRALALPFFRGRFTGVGQRLTMPRPDDAPMAHSPGVDPDRILVFGNGAAVGWGVRSHDLALPGHLARQLSALTHRGATVDVVADPLMTIQSAAAEVPETRLPSYDAIVVIVGLSDALRMTSPRRFRQGMADLLASLTAHRHKSASITVVGIHPPSTLNVFSLRWHSVVDEHAERLNAITRELCEPLDDVRFVIPPVSPTPVTVDPSRSHLAPELFQSLAVAIAPEIAGPLDVHFARGREFCPLRDRVQTDEERLRAIRALGILDSPHEKRFDDIVERARILLAASGAAFSIVDEDRIWNKSIAGAAVIETPLRGAMCAVTIQSGGPLIVPDVWSDDRFVTHPSVRFYAGYPVESPDGIRIGALCVTDPQPRPADTVDLVLLRELALAVQRELASGPLPVAA